jgi:hypothetical protein
MRSERGEGERTRSGATRESKTYLGAEESDAAGLSHGGRLDGGIKKKLRVIIANGIALGVTFARNAHCAPSRWIVQDSWTWSWSCGPRHPQKRAASPHCDVQKLFTVPSSDLHLIVRLILALLRRAAGLFREL